MDNKKIAKELIKIAKEIKSGGYKYEEIKGIADSISLRDIIKRLAEVYNEKHINAVKRGNSVGARLMQEYVDSLNKFHSRLKQELSFV